MKKLFFVAAAALLLAGCVQVEDRAKLACEELCNKSRLSINMSNGPCLGQLTGDLADWVCDVAHDPRQPVDNLAENQCPAFRSGAAHHFVEVDEGCSAFRAG